MDLGYELAIPLHVESEELIGADIRAMICDLLGKVTPHRAHTAAVRCLILARIFMKQARERDAILACIKMRRSAKGRDAC